MGSSAKFGLLVLMALVVAMARFLEGEVRPHKPKAFKLHAKAADPRAVTPAPIGPLPGARPRAPSVVAPPTGPKKYKVRGGDTLGQISRRVYGTTRYWRTILKANSPLLRGRPERLKPGMELTIPSKPKKRT